MEHKELLAPFVPVVLRFFANKVASGSDADDCAQQTFERLLARIEREPARNMEALLLGIARNVLHEYWRGLARRRSTDDIGELSLAEMGAGVSTLVNAEQWRRILCDALRTLRLDYQTVLELHYWEGKTHQQIADALGLPVGTVSTWIKKGKQKLYEHLSVGAKQGDVLSIGHDELERRLRIMGRSGGER